eukprot:14664061-Alexandrium_andersonii.AAC.1
MSGCLQLRPGVALTGADTTPHPNARVRSHVFQPPPPAPFGRAHGGAFAPPFLPQAAPPAGGAQCGAGL